MANIFELKMPKWGMEMSEGVVTQWHVTVGDKVAVGQDLVDVETSKIVNTVTAHAAGTVRRIVAASNETHPVGAILALMAESGVSEAEIDGYLDAKKVTAPVTTPAAAEHSAPINAEPVSPIAAEPVATTPSITPAAAVRSGEFVDGNASPVARRLARVAGIDLTAISGSGRGGRASKADVEAAIRASGGTPPALKGSSAPRSAPKTDDSHVNATPVARRLAAQHGVNLHDCRATGSRGRVCKEDVERLLGVVATTPEFGDAAETAAQPITTELSGMRKVIAARLQSSKQQAPHYRVNMDVGVDALMAARAEANQATSAAKLSVNDFLIKAVACALVKVPALNVQFDGTSVTQFSHADIAVAVAIDDGLITPIIKAAEGKSLTAISNEVRQLATQAKRGTLQASQFQGGTFTISNLGMYGVTQFDAILNPPQVGILAVGGSFARLELDNDQQLCQRSYITLSLASDHRVIDGAVAASFLQALKGFIEQPATMLL